MSQSVIVYVSSTSGSSTVKKQQQHILNVLDSLKIPHEQCDVSSTNGLIQKMRELMGDSSATVPQIFVGDQHKGNYEDFNLKVEDMEVKQWLGVE